MRQSGCKVQRTGTNPVGAWEETEWLGWQGSTTTSSKAWIGHCKKRPLLLCVFGHKEHVYTYNNKQKTHYTYNKNKKTPTPLASTPMQIWFKFVHTCGQDKDFANRRSVDKKESSTMGRKRFVHIWRTYKLQKICLFGVPSQICSSWGRWSLIDFNLVLSQGHDLRAFFLPLEVVFSGRRIVGYSS